MYNILQHNDEQVTVAEGFDMKLINQTLRSFDFTFKDTPLKQVWFVISVHVFVDGGDM